MIKTKSKAGTGICSVQIPRKNDDIDIQQVWEEFFETSSEQCRNILLEKYLFLVKYSADRIWAKLPDKIDLDDLVQAGIFGLMDAIDAFDPSRGVKFETYCSPRVRGSILDELRSMDWVPRLVRARSHQLESATQTLRAELGRMPTEDELAEELKLNEVEFNRLRRDANATTLISLNNKFSDDDDDSAGHEVDIVEDRKSKDPIRKAQREDLKQLFSKGLTRSEKLIVLLYYYEEMTMKEIGTTLDLSESRVSQMHSMILDRLKGQMQLRTEEFLVNADAIL
ncbi:MAG: FliA/WhiG family RNA polymerase sigma factor [Planctomycetota bacterium]|jgi:RNA polymerase sigma factor for flagellar operon FliA